MHAANDNKILMGAAAIAEHLGITRRQAYRLVYDDLPTFKLGGTVAARPAEITEWLEGKRRAA
ncbi:helix-turn-helix domain-containing protein [Nitratireductor aquimarinus]|uniref:helix-turn-helix transcriptional regulator n=1 Tax=Nitratireductor aquimarinus TaxID=889300 RepID=UPI001A8E450E|nr:helix-turn-helix domain-containing protein [Nitratireductor aquimarinus]MBN8245245.1 helix-turn-helix domain-containing protein [Nitratireductor aquimarinus]MBY6133630.1 helix-turn-helix domain-containing protein [Nitratireductor aquimarinus]MCA1304719.1 helix-turn-helix domain-containing protein [Nitratireductor aquimarinus]